MTEKPSAWRTRQTENLRSPLRTEDTVLHEGRRWCVLESGGVFHLRLAASASDVELIPPYTLSALKAHGVLYRPIHPSMTAEDIEGATFAHDDGSAWHFAHCSPHEQVDLAAHIQTFAKAQFDGLVHRAVLKVHEATNDIVRAAAVAKADALVRFAEGVGAEVYRVILAATLGHWHRNPHNDHSRELTAVAIDTVLAIWTKAGETDKAVRQDRAAVAASAVNVRTALQLAHTIEWRAARAAREAAAKKAAEAAATETAETDTSSEGA